MLGGGGACAARRGRARPVSLQNCPSLSDFYSKQQEVSGTPATPVCPAGVPGTPGRCPNDLLSLCAFFFPETRAIKAFGETAH